MPIPHELIRIVAFACTKNQFGDDQTIRTLGTGFIIGVPFQKLHGYYYLYYVTAAHVVDGVPEIYVRIKTKDDLVDDVLIDKSDWCYHIDTSIDIAVAPFPGSLTGAEYHQAYTPENFLTQKDERPFLGDPVYFIGMLSTVDAMRLKNIPMVRSGTIGIMNQDNIPVKGFAKTRMIKAHLIDCRSTNGFSGAPCFVQNPVTGKTNLFGIVAAHFDESIPVSLEGNVMPEVLAHVPMNSGVGVITPIHYLRELLNYPYLVDQRNEREAFLVEKRVPIVDNATPKRS